VAFFVRQKQVRTVVLQPARANRQSAAEWVRLTQAAYTRTQPDCSQWTQTPDTDAEGVPSGLEFLSPEYVDNRAAAFRKVDGWLLEFQSQSRPTVVFVQGTTDLPIHQHLPMLGTVPVKHLQVQRGDVELYKHATVFTVFTAAVMERVMEHFAKLMASVDEAIRMARYANVPLCNLEVDMAIGVIDVAFGRLLRNNSHLLWCTSGARPDLGGAEGDDNKFTTCEEVLASLQPVDINSPGAHLTYSVSLDVSHLEVYAVIYSQALLDSDLSALQLQQESTQVLSAFNLLREMLSMWYADALSGSAGASASDHLLQHVFRWLKTRSSLLYDPALYRFTMQLVKKAFTNLLQRMLKVGSRIVFANFQRIIINTPKLSGQDARSYINFLLGAIRDNVLLQRLSLVPTAYYTTLLWLDRMNHVLLQWQPDPEPAPGTPVAAEGPFTPTALLAVGRYFPEEAGRRLRDHALRVMVAVANFKAELLQVEAAKPEASQANREAILKHCEAFMADYVKDQLQSRLLADVEKMTKFAASRHHMRQLPGSGCFSADCALEYIKTTCHLLALHPPLAAAIHPVKANLLRLVGVRPFDPAAQFTDPAHSAVVLSDVMCAFCNEVMDIDLVRDENFSPGKEWVCLVCHRPISRDLVEAQLVDQVNLALMAYQVQDLQCVKCKQVKADYLLQYCPCSGDYRTKTSAQDFANQVRTLLDVAEYHGLAWLQETASWALQQP